MGGNKKNNKIVRMIAWLSLVLFIMAFLLISAIADSSDAVIVRDLFYAVMGVATIIALVSAAVKSRGRSKKVWILMALFGAFWASGDLALRLCEITGILGPERVLCFPDIFFLAAYIVLVAIVVLLGRATETPGSITRWVKFYPLAVIVFSIAISVALAVFLPRGVAGGPIGTSSLDFSMIVNYLYTAIDVCIVSGLLLIILVNKTHLNRPWEVMIVLGLATFSVADLSYSLFKPAGIYDPTTLPTQIIVAMWLSGYGLLSMAAIYKLTEPSSG